MALKTGGLIMNQRGSRGPCETGRSRNKSHNDKGRNYNVVFDVYCSGDTWQTHAPPNLGVITSCVQNIFM